MCNKKLQYKNNYHKSLIFSYIKCNFKKLKTTNTKGVLSWFNYYSQDIPFLFLSLTIPIKLLLEVLQPRLD